MLPQNTWGRQDAGLGGNFLNDVTFVDATHGWAVGNCGVISATTDGGRTWTIQAGLPMSPACSRAALTSVSFADRLNGWVVGGGVLLATDNGGRTWAPAPVPAKGYYDAFRLDAQHGWLVGYDVVLATTDGGVTWTQGTLPRPRLGLLSVTFPTPSTGWAAGIDHADGGSKGVVLASTDGGLTWTVSPSAPTSTLRDVAATGAGKAWAVGTDVLAAR
jgi:photosystem II stability/assembly factor-like uncharacterized protein